MNLVLNTPSLRCLQGIQRELIVPHAVEFMSLEFVGVGWAGEREIWELLDNLKKS